MIGIIIMTVLAASLGTCLVVVDSKFHTESKSDIYLELLPGYNCGVCGYSGCEAMSEAMLKDVNQYKKCRPLRGDKLKAMEVYLNNHS